MSAGMIKMDPRLIPSVLSPLSQGSLGLGSGRKFYEWKSSKGIELLESKYPEWEKLNGFPDQKDMTAKERSDLGWLLENTQVWLSSFDETTRQQQIGNFDKFAFPLVRAVFPNLIAHKISHVQPMPGPQSFVFYMDYTYGTSKGSVQAGQRAFSSISGPEENFTYGSENVTSELLGTGDGGTTVFSGNLASLPVYPDTFQVTAGSVVGFDDGAGLITGAGIASGTIDYDTGAYSITYSVAPANGVEILSNYRYDTEANEDTPEFDLQITSAPVTAEHYKIRIRTSLEAQFSARSLHGLDAMGEMFTATVEEIKFEIDRKIINDLFAVALAGNVDWAITIPAGVSFAEHKLSFIDALVEQGNLVYRATKRGNTNFQVVSVDVANIVETLPTFTANDGAFDTQSGSGVVDSGILHNRWKIYKDPFLGKDLPNTRVWFGGYKGNTFKDVGYVYAPWLLPYATPRINLDDFVTRQGIGTAFATRAINPRFYSTGSIVN